MSTRGRASAALTIPPSMAADVGVIAESSRGSAIHEGAPLAGVPYGHESRLLGGPNSLCRRGEEYHHE